MRLSARSLSLIAVFAALGVVCDSIVTPTFSAGVWYGWIFMISPLAGIVLGPYNGFISTLIAVMIGHSLVPRETAYEFVFTLGAPIGSMVSGFIFKGEWKKAFAFYTIMLASYFATPISWQLPIWGIWDCLTAYILLIILGFIISTRGVNEIKRVSPFTVSAFLGLEADVLFRIFVFIPCQTYHFFYGLPPEALVAIWTAPAPIITPFKVLLSTFIVTLIGPQIMQFSISSKDGN